MKLITAILKPFKLDDVKNALQAHGHHGGVIHIWIPGVGVLKKPTRWRRAWLDIFSPITPKSALFCAQPIACIFSGNVHHGEAAIRQRVQRNARVPHWTEARLNTDAIALLINLKVMSIAIARSAIGTIMRSSYGHYRHPSPIYNG